MRNLITIGVIVALLLPGRSLAATSQSAPPAVTPATTQHVEDVLTDIPQDVLARIDTAQPAIPDVSDARFIIEKTIGARTASEPVKALPDARDFYCLIHVMKWNITDDPNKPDGKKADPSTTDKWYVYHGGRWTEQDFNANNRVFGAHRVWILFLHLNLPQEVYVPRYQVSVQPKLPAVLTDLAGVASLFFTVSKAAKAADHDNKWGGGYVDIADVPSDVTVQPLRRVTAAGSNEFVKLGEPRTFDNEGRYWLDFSVGVPIRAAKQLTVDDAGNVSPDKVEKQHVFALVDLYPQPVDVKNLGFNRWPHLVAGVAVQDKPLDTFLVAAGWGPAFAHFYIGSMFVKQPKANGASGKSYDAQFAFGINLTVRGTQEALKKAAK